MRSSAQHIARVKSDLENDEEIEKISFCSSLLDTFDDLVENLF